MLVRPWIRADVKALEDKAREDRAAIEARIGERLTRMETRILQAVDKSAASSEDPERRH